MKDDWEDRQRRLDTMRWFAQILAVGAAAVSTVSWLLADGSTIIFAFSWVGLVVVTALTVRGRRIARKSRATRARIEEAEVLLNWASPD